MIKIKANQLILILALRKPDHSFKTLLEMSKKYGPIFTIYFGTWPNVFITDLDVAQEAYRKNEFSGRPYLDFSKCSTLQSLSTQSTINHSLDKIFCGEKGVDIIFSDFGREWEVLRRVAFAAVRKYAVHEQLPRLVADIVDEVVNTIKKTHGSEPFDTDDYLYLMTFNILAQISYGQK